MPAYIIPSDVTPTCDRVIPANNRVIPAKAGIYPEWIPAFAGMTFAAGIPISKKLIKNTKTIFKPA